MSHVLPMRPEKLDLQATVPLLTLLNPRHYTRWVLISLGASLLVSALAMVYAGLPLWGATGLVLLAMVPVGIFKWREDRRLYGTTAMILSILLVAQGAHTVEHLVQWAQYHLLYWTMRQSSGLLSPANAEWVHFVWNWSVLIVVILLLRGGMRNPWTWMLLAVAGFHAVEHSYTFIRYQMVLRELTAMDVLNVTAQGLPGIVGRDGWLARSPWTQGTFLCSIPGLTTAIRLDVHFWWNTIETALLIVGGHVYLRTLPEFRSRE